MYQLLSAKKIIIIHFKGAKTQYFAIFDKMQTHFYGIVGF